MAVESVIENLHFPFSQRYHTVHVTHFEIKLDILYDTRGLFATPRQQNSAGISGGEGIVLCSSKPCLWMTGRYAKVMADISFVMYVFSNFLHHPVLFTDKSNPPRQQIFHRNPELSQSPSVAPKPERESVHRGSDKAWSPS